MPPSKTAFPRCRHGVLLIFVAAALGGCATVPMVTDEEDAEAKEFRVPEDKSRIYVYRNERFAGAIRMDLSVDGRMIGRTAPMTFHMVDVEPGNHTISSHAEIVSTIQVRAKPGKAHFVWQEVKMGTWVARSKLHRVPEAQGRAGVSACRMALSDRPSRTPARQSRNRSLRSEPAPQESR